MLRRGELWPDLELEGGVWCGVGGMTLHGMMHTTQPPTQHTNKASYCVVWCGWDGFCWGWPEKRRCVWWAATGRKGKDWVGGGEMRSSEFKPRLSKILTSVGSFSPGLMALHFKPCGLRDIATS